MIMNTTERITKTQSKVALTMPIPIEQLERGILAGAGALDILQEHDWPGNIRELQKSIKMRGDVIAPERLPPDFAVNMV